MAIPDEYGGYVEFDYFIDEVKEVKPEPIA